MFIARTKIISIWMSNHYHFQVCLKLPILLASTVLVNKFKLNDDHTFKLKLLIAPYCNDAFDKNLRQLDCNIY